MSPDNQRRERRIVLIIPYGIEISLEVAKARIKSVLIIPYGIEIRISVPSSAWLKVLIIPYGIEIYYSPVAGPY